MKIVIPKFFLVNSLMITLNHTVVCTNHSVISINHSVVYKNISYIYKLYLVVFVFLSDSSRFPFIEQCSL